MAFSNSAVLPFSTAVRDTTLLLKPLVQYPREFRGLKRCSKSLQLLAKRAKEKKKKEKKSQQQLSAANVTTQIAEAPFATAVQRPISLPQTRRQTSLFVVFIKWPTIGNRGGSHGLQVFAVTTFKWRNASGHVRPDLH